MDEKIVEEIALGIRCAGEDATYDLMAKSVVSRLDSLGYAIVPKHDLEPFANIMRKWDSGDGDIELFVAQCDDFGHSPDFKFAAVLKLRALLSTHIPIVKIENLG